MKSVLISIQPKWCELIANGKKTVEVRKTKPKLETPFKVYIYCTKDNKNTFFPPLTQKLLNESPKDFVIDRRGNGKVIGEFVCNEITVAECGSYCVLPKPKTMLDELDLLEYANGKTVYGWHISDLVIYDKPKELSEFRTLCEYRNNDGSCQYTKVECDCVKFDYNPDYSVNFAECCDFMIRPPQSWCYVERSGNNGE